MSSEQIEKFSQTSHRDYFVASSAPMSDAKKSMWKLIPPALGCLAGGGNDDVNRTNSSSSEQTAKSSPPLHSKETGAVWKRSYCRSVSTDSEQSDDDEDQDFELRPLIKKELRNTIQKRRWQRGLLDWGLEDYDKKIPPDNQLTPEESMKREDRKQRNRVAANKCRHKRRRRLEELQKTMDSLEMRRDELIQLKDKLSQEKKQLRQMVEEHFNLCNPSMLRTT